MDFFQGEIRQDWIKKYSHPVMVGHIKKLICDHLGISTTTTPALLSDSKNHRRYLNHSMSLINTAAEPTAVGKGRRRQGPGDYCSYGLLLVVTSWPRAVVQSGDITAAPLSTPVSE